MTLDRDMGVPVRDPNPPNEMVVFGGGRIKVDRESLEPLEREQDAAYVQHLRRELRETRSALYVAQAREVSFVERIQQAREAAYYAGYDDGERNAKDWGRDLIHSALIAAVGAFVIYVLVNW